MTNWTCSNEKVTTILLLNIIKTKEYQFWGVYSKYLSGMEWMRLWDKRKHFGERGKWRRKDIYHLMRAPPASKPHIFSIFLFWGAAKGRNREGKYIIWSNPSKTLFNYIQLLEYAILTTYVQPFSLFSVRGQLGDRFWKEDTESYAVTWLHRPKKRNLVTTGSCSYVVTQILGESFTM